MKFFSCLFAFVIINWMRISTVNAASYVVSPDGGGNFTSITAAANEAQPGDKIQIRAGTYKESLTPSRSGTGGHPIIFTNYNNEKVIISEVTEGLSLVSKSYIIIDGIEFSNVDSFALIYNGHHNEVKNSTFGPMRKFSQWSGFIINGGSTNNWIHHNTMYRWGYEDISGDYGDLLTISDSGAPTIHNLIEQNIIAYGGHDTFDIQSRYNVIRNNYLHNEPWTNGYGNRTMEIAYHFGNNAEAEYNLIEGNRFAFTGEPSDAEFGAGIQLAAPNNIVRYNFFYNNAGPGVSFSTWFGEGDTRSENNHVYNNVFFHNGYTTKKGYWQGGILFSETGNFIKNNVIKNNIFYQNTISPIVYAGNVRDDPLIPSDQFIENNLIDRDPLFVDIISTQTPQDPGHPDFHLKSNSPAIDSGKYLTRTAMSGNNALLTVEDAKYFSDGFGIVAADWIQIGNHKPVQIKSIDYNSNTITLNESSTWSSSEPVYLYKNSTGKIVFHGSAPDIGAIEFDPGQIALTPTPTSILCTMKSSGDANCDGIVNLIDFESWRKEYMGSNTNSFADFNSDSMTNLVDFEIWRMGYLVDIL